MFFWILYWDSEGQYGLKGPYNSSSEADRIAQRLDVSDYEIEKLPTLNEAKATRMLKGILSDREPEKFKKFVKRWRHK